MCNLKTVHCRCVLLPLVLRVLCSSSLSAFMRCRFESDFEGLIVQREGQADEADLFLNLDS